MKKILTIITCLLLASALRAQVFPKVELRLLHGIDFDSSGYHDYTETQRTEALARFYYSPVFFGIGMGYNHPDRYGSIGCPNITLQAGCKIPIRRFNFDIYVEFEKKFIKDPPARPMLGCGVSAAFQIVSRLYVTAEFNSQWPVSGYASHYYARSLAGTAMLGIAIYI